MLGGCGGSFGTAATASCSPASGTTLASTCVTGGATTSGGGYARTGSGAVDSRLASGVTAEFAISTASGVAAAGAAACAVRASSGSGGASGGGLSLYARGIRCVSGPVVLRPNQQASLASPARDQERRQSPAEMPVACISGTGLIGPGGSTPCFASSQSSRRLFGPAGGFGGAGWGGRLLRCAMAQRNGDIAAALASLQQHMQPPLILGPPPGGAPMQQQVLVAAVDELPAGSRTLLHFIQQQCASHAGSEPAAASGPGPGFNSLDQLRMLTSMALQIARGMEHLHAHGQSHGSLSPCAVFVSPAAPGGGEQQPGAKEEEAVPVEGRARSGSSPYSPRSVFHAPVCCKIALAGLVNPMELASHLAIHPGEWGPVSYMAPECFAAGSSGGSPSSSNGTGTGGGGGAGRALSGIASGGVGASPLMRVDVNAYGALIYHMFNGVAPFHQYHPAQVLVGLASGGLQLQWRPQLYGSRRAPVPDAIRSLVIRCMSHTPVARPTFHEIVRILECLAQTI
ncbi:hypothetical protein HYH02_000845 [Chlamydomonas schloesseri]|uniref:Protein kinase domain-containing protein n=1 Tax=Chlamydomonas schloesseri TaxID=2026947 RepID=A0A835WWF2_9CHLO|nr:hypothetical protein HYH02_000845 [Chlamydomonas schloesseri]|eukprot:KAG2455020.1 hypothetical protein HYH02_000845 [Chlamydomonas schloesseri]